MGLFNMDSHIKANEIMDKAEAKHTIERLLKDLYDIKNPTDRQSFLIKTIKESMEELESTLQ